MKAASYNQRNRRHRKACAQEPHRALHAISIFWYPTAGPARKFPLTSSLPRLLLSPARLHPSPPHGDSPFSRPGLNSLVLSGGGTLSSLLAEMNVS